MSSASTSQDEIAARFDAVFGRACRVYSMLCRARIEDFCARHFSVEGAWRIHRKALGHDLWKVPVNALWAIPYLASQGLSVVSSKLGWRQAAERLRRLPPGFQTAVAREIEWLIHTELLQLPIQQQGRQSAQDSLLALLMSDEEVARRLGSEWQTLAALDPHGRARDKLEEYLMVYAGSRVAANDLAGSLLSMAAGAAALQKFTPGAVALGAASAAVLAQEIAIANFALGPALGSLYYGLFPAAASTGLIVASVSSLMAALGVIAAFSGIVTDPLQSLLGLHQRRLHKLLDALDAQLQGQDGQFKLHDAYLARVLDLIDLIRGAARIVK